jgi:hypothetical protein
MTTPERLALEAGKPWPCVALASLADVPLHDAPPPDVAHRERRGPRTGAPHSPRVWRALRVA